jgi:hypothetical protein
MNKCFFLVILPELSVNMINPMAQNFFLKEKFINFKDFGPVLVDSNEDIIVTMIATREILEHFSEIFDLFLLRYLLLRDE